MARTGKVPITGGDTPRLEEPPPLTRSEIRELKRSISDLEDRTRYLLVSVFTPKHALYYDVSEDVFAMDTPSSGTLFKRRSAALAIRRLLRSHVEIVQCRVSRRGRLVKSSVPRLRPSWRRKLRARRQAASRHA